MPRPASSLWSHFRKDATNKRAICKYCQHNMCGLVTRMRTHLARKCPDCPANVKTEMFDADLNRKMDMAIVPSAGENQIQYKSISCVPRRLTETCFLTL